MATERVTSFLASKDIHVMYQLTRDELHSVAEEFGVILQGEKKEELQIEVKTFLEKGKRTTQSPGGFSQSFPKLTRKPIF